MLGSVDRVTIEEIGGGFPEKTGSCRHVQDKFFSNLTQISHTMLMTLYSIFGSIFKIFVH